MALLTVDFFSKTLGKCEQMTVILPQNTQGQIGLDGKGGTNYPTLYLLHGLSDDHTIWLRRTSIERYVSNLGIAVVMPNGGRQWYTDGPFGKYFTYIADELPEICREFFPNMSSCREDNYLAGNSMGGYGAFKIAMLRPERFSMAAALSGAMKIERFGARDDLAPIFAGALEGSENDLFHVASGVSDSDKARLRLFQWCGTEDFLYQDNLAMRDALTAEGFDLTYSEAKGNHSWPHWDTRIVQVLDWIMKARKERNQ